jgi:uncharacterized protein (TIGR02246 family)
MKQVVSLIGGAAIALAIFGCNEPMATPDADIQAIKTDEKQWNQEYVSKDLDKIAAHYAEDAVLMTPGGPSISGKTAIHDALKQMVADPAFSLKFQPSVVSVAKAGDLAYTQGSYTLTVTDSQTKQIVNDHGSYVTVYRKQADGGWKAVSDIASSAVPPPVAAPGPTPAKKH